MYSVSLTLIHVFSLSEIQTNGEVKEVEKFHVNFKSPLTNFEDTVIIGDWPVKKRNF